ncbi:MAG TPA: hypothetical protein VKA84_19345 [Gemmatimonadaceae bacterium]|nr:hypothetical protein [Gemmatimonadaceae bacterium]
MQLLSMHVDTVRALQRLHIPFDDLTPDGLWGTPYHLIGVTGDQRDVLNAWGVAYDEVTPAVFQRTGLGVAPAGGSSNGGRGGAGAAGSRIDARPEPRAEFRPEPRPESRAAEPRTAEPPPPAAAPTTAATPVSAPPPPAPATPAPAPAPAAPASSGAKPASSGAATATAPAADDQLRDGTRLRTSFRGRYREATVRGGKILLDGRSFDSLTQASTSISTDKNDWEFWEYFDDTAGKWRMLDREWQA